MSHRGHLGVTDLGQQRIASYLCTLMGLALSNEHVLNAFYLPAHMLSLCMVHLMATASYSLANRADRRLLHSPTLRESTHGSISTEGG